MARMISLAATLVLLLAATTPAAAKCDLPDRWMGWQVALYNEPSCESDLDAVRIGGGGSPAGVFLTRAFEGPRDLVLRVEGADRKNQVNFRVRVDGGDPVWHDAPEGSDEFRFAGATKLELLIYADVDFDYTLRRLDLFPANLASPGQSRIPGHLRAVEDGGGAAAKSENEYLEAERKELERLARSQIGSLSEHSDVEKVREILRHLSSVSVIAYNEYGSTKERFRAAVIYKDYGAGIGQLCNGLSNAAFGLYDVYGFEVRRIRGQSIRPGHPDYDRWLEAYGSIGSHSIIEVRLDGRWVIVDSTYFMMPMHEGRYISLAEGLALFIEGRAGEIAFDYVSDRNTVEDYFSGHSEKYWQDLMFSRYIVYKPFHKYPYDDVYELRVTTPVGERFVQFYAGDIVLGEVERPPVEWAHLQRR